MRTADHTFLFTWRTWFNAGATDARMVAGEHATTLLLALSVEWLFILADMALLITLVATWKFTFTYMFTDDKFSFEFTATSLLVHVSTGEFDLNFNRASFFGKVDLRWLSTVNLNFVTARQSLFDRYVARREAASLDLRIRELVAIS